MPGKGWEAPIAAYSEFMPPPRPILVEHAAGSWPITEAEEHFELSPGLSTVARQVVGALAKLIRGEPAHGIARAKLTDNPYWPEDLSGRAGKVPHDRCCTILPLALSRTQDDKGRVRWTLFGSSEQGPGRAFWRSFGDQDGELGLAFFRRLLTSAFDEKPEGPADLRRAFRILPGGEGWSPTGPVDDPLPSWVSPLRWTPGRTLGAIRYLLTFRPFSTLPGPIRRAYLDGSLQLIPSPASLIFWGVPGYARLQRELPLAIQIPLLPLVARNDGPQGLRVPQSGWLHEPRPGMPGPDQHHGPLRNTYARTHSHRGARIERDEEPQVVGEREDRMAHVLFSADAEHLGLYGKPMARNAQVWTADDRLLLDGPLADRDSIRRAAARLAEGGHFGYRFQFPAMRVGRQEVYWQRPLVAYLDPSTDAPAVLPGAPLGYLTAYEADRPDPSRAAEFRPVLLQRPAFDEAIRLFEDDRPARRTTQNVANLLNASDTLKAKLPRAFAGRLLAIPKTQTLETWLRALPARAHEPARGRWLADELRGLLADEGPTGTASLTFAMTARRSFEVAYWRAISALSGGRFQTKNNADCVRNAPTNKALAHHRRDLDALGDYLLTAHTRSIARSGMAGKALVGDLPFRWRTDFDFGWSDGWRANQEGGPPRERDLIVVIPGRDRGRAIVMADHYDTAYREDLFKRKPGGARIAAPGADDNGSATAALLRAAPAFLELSRRGRLGCDVWLVHLTGEEFPADCLGARHLAHAIVGGSLAMRLPDGRPHDLSAVEVGGVYVLDMVAHNGAKGRDIFQIAPGTGPESLRLALWAHLANESWNASLGARNRRAGRRGRGRGQRSADGGTIPAIAAHLPLIGEVRPHDDRRSTLYNSDGQVFSDAGIPTVLFMENYDINRSGYHDSRDTMANIDLDYGAALVSIAIEAVARATFRGSIPAPPS